MVVTKKAFWIEFGIRTAYKQVINLINKTETGNNRILFPCKKGGGGIKYYENTFEIDDVRNSVLLKSNKSSGLASPMGHAIVLTKVRIDSRTNFMASRN